MKKVAMFVTNPCTHDARVMKEAKSLASNGFQVRVFALANAHYEPGIFEQDGYKVQRLKFQNVFKRTQDVIWGVTGKLLLPIRLFFKGLRLTLSFVARSLKLALTLTLTSLAAIPAILIKYIFPGLHSRVFSEDRRLFGINSDSSLDLSRIQLLARRIRIFRVCLNRKLKSWSVKRINRSRILSVLRVFNLALFKIIRFFRLLIIKLKRTIYVLPRSRFRRYYVKSRLFLIKKTNRAVYRLLLPAHKISTYYFFCKSASAEALKWNANIAHAHDLNTMYAAYIVKKNNGAKVVYDSHELWIHRNRVGRKATLETIIDKIAERKLIRYADQIITVCDSIGNWLMDRYSDIPKPAILRNMPYQPEELMGVNDDSGDLKSRLGLSEDSLTMMYTGKITSGRGIEIGIAALSEISNLNLILLGYGEAGYVDDLKQKILSRGVVDRVYFCDPVPYQEVPRFIKGADFALVYIEPICLSYEFALPNKLFESIQAGIPIMGSGLVEIKKVVDGFDVGLCFNSEEELFTKLKSLEGDQLLKWRQNLNKLKNKLSWDVEQNVLFDAYSQLS